MAQPASRDGLPLYASVYAQNDLGQISELVTTPVVCDSTPPSLPASGVRTLVDVDALAAGAGALVLDVNVSTMFTSFDVHSSITAVRTTVLLGNVSTSTCARSFVTEAAALACVSSLPTLIAWQSHDAEAREVVHTALSVAVTSSVRTGVMVTNAVGRVTVAFTLTAVSIASIASAQAVTLGAVFVGQTAFDSVVATTSRSSLVASWRGFGAPAVVEVAFGTHAGDASLSGGSFHRVQRVQAQAGFGSSSFMMNVSSALTAGTTVFATIRASDADGEATVEASSVGVVIVPPAEAVHVGFGASVGSLAAGLTSRQAWVNWMCAGLEDTPVPTAHVS
ncbi:hypothetical protein EON68_04435, partial [archaeon]